jgi:hypothetical protein
VADVAGTTELQEEDQDQPGPQQFSTVSVRRGAPSSARAPQAAKHHVLLTWLLPLGGYLLLGFGLWWHAWSGSPASLVPAGSTDSEQALWFFAWVPYALEHHLNPFFSAWINVPHGVNVVANPSDLLPAALLAPIEWAAGPVVALLLAISLAPALTAFSFFALARRYVSVPSAAVGGVVFGFSPALLTEVRYAHLHVAFLALVPLIVLLGDEISRSDRWGPAPLGALLGVVVAAQFFVSPEVLAITAVVAVVAGLFYVPGQLLAGRIPPSLRRRLVVAGAWATGVACALLAYPLWLFLAGPEHYTRAPYAQSSFPSTVVGAVLPGHATRAVGYLGAPDTAYLGIPLVAALIVARVLLRDVTLVRRSIDLAAAAWVLSLGYTLHLGTAGTPIPLPGRLLGWLPLGRDILFFRFSLIVMFFVALALAGVLDRLPTRVWRVALTAAVIIPLLVVRGVPFPMTRVAVPAALTSAPVRALPAGAVVLTYPEAGKWTSMPMAWQAIDGMRYKALGGYGIFATGGGLAEQGPPPDSFTLLFAGATFGRLPPTLVPAEVRAMRTEARGDKLDAIIVVGQAPHAGELVHLLSEAFGSPTVVTGGYLWRSPARTRGPAS